MVWGRYWVFQFICLELWGCGVGGENMEGEKKVGGEWVGWGRLEEKEQRVRRSVCGSRSDGIGKTCKG